MFKFQSSGNRNPLRTAIPYTLFGGDNSSDPFYKQLSLFTDEIIKQTSGIILPQSRALRSFTDINKTESLRTDNEYILDLLIAGILSRNYLVSAKRTSFPGMLTLGILYKLRSAGPIVKIMADRIRGILSCLILQPESGDNVSPGLTDFRDFRRIIMWLSATGEFKEEVFRLKNMALWIQSRNRIERISTFTALSLFAEAFTKIAETYFREYTSNVSSFRHHASVIYRHREDYFFVNRHQNEYHMNMFGAEIINRQMRNDFISKPKKAVLVPTCMRAIKPEVCKARSDGIDLVCAQCNDGCFIGQTATALAPLAVTVYLIPHSSDFSRFLIKWKDCSDTGLIGIACVLNLLTGGYEMKRLGIIAQCVFLDYSGCAKHWTTNGCPSTLNITRLLTILGTAPGRSDPATN